MPACQENNQARRAKYAKAKVAETGKKLEALSRREGDSSRGGRVYDQTGKTYSTKCRGPRRGFYFWKKWKGAARADGFVEGRFFNKKRKRFGKGGTFDIAHRISPLHQPERILKLRKREG